MPCVSGVLSQHVAACRVETTLRGVVVGAAYRVGWRWQCTVRWVGGWSSCRHGDSRLFVRSFVRSFARGVILPHSNCSGGVRVFVCVRVYVCVCSFVRSCVRAFVRSCAFAPLPPSLPPYIYIYIYLYISIYIYISIRRHLPGRLV